MATLTSTVTPTAPTARTVHKRRRHTYPPATPYLLLLPAILLELLVHVVPIAVGIWMSIKGLTLFYIRNWSQAPSVGLHNYRTALDFDTPTGRELLHSLGVTVAYTVLVVGIAWL